MADAAEITALRANIEQRERELEAAVRDLKLAEPADRIPRYLLSLK